MSPVIDFFRIKDQNLGKEPWFLHLHAWVVFLEPFANVKLCLMHTCWVLFQLILCTYSSVLQVISVSKCVPNIYLFIFFSINYQPHGVGRQDLTFFLSALQPCVNGKVKWWIWIGIAGKIVNDCKFATAIGTRFLEELADKIAVIYKIWFHNKI